MKIFHTADWHLGKLLQGVYMTEDQRHILLQFIEEIKNEKPDVVIIAGDLYDRSIPTSEAVDLLNDMLGKIVLELKTPVLAIAGNHDSPRRLEFGSKMMSSVGFHIAGNLSATFSPVIYNDEHGEVHFHLIPYTEPSLVKHELGLEDIKTHNDAMEAIIAKINEQKDKQARHVVVGHCFVTPTGEKRENTSDSERPLSIGGAEHVSAAHFTDFHYTALGHLHQAHHVKHEKIRYAGSPLKYSVSEERHKKGFLIVELDKNGEINVEKRFLQAKRDIRIVEGLMEDIEKHEQNEDYVFVRLLDETPVISPMERIRAVYPNAMHVERKSSRIHLHEEQENKEKRANMDQQSLFKSFYKEVKGTEPSEDTQSLFSDVLQEMLEVESERK
ncbi:exonuclease sbcCD subunit D [Lottiidibacillus patelloidae]|uniref:Nuclease SbcCD subunit D n=1 Tax=Lottiidibacillus patelloidae TaxID=2670334 RepID=A0A263BRH0_9BACI|nr:exonuclease SbcCD subunit D [Lottiidibacillus patelloidae]OZM56303.1 exonuclease sbcCD subunit D [Lottiidibacillus patelloidae]